MDATQLRVLGGPAVVVDDVERSVGGPKTQHLLAVLVANRGRSVSCERLVDALWPDHPPRSAVATVQTQISRLRSVLHPGFGIELDPAGYRLVTASGEVDATRFEELVAQASLLDHVDSVAVLEAALGSWTGRAFGPFADQPEVLGEAIRLEELRLVATDRWARGRLATGDAAEMIGELEALVIGQPLRESSCCLLMIALNRCGRQAEALRRATEFRSRLQEETGLSPSTTFVELETQILDQDPRLRAPHEVDWVGRGNRTEHHLRGATEFIGREGVSTALQSAIADQPLVTITGPGGVGKTRLATHVAGNVFGDFPDGVTVVELASQRDLQGAARAVARALDIQPYNFQSIESTVEDHLTSARMLLLIDNCEHLIEAVAPLVDRLRSACPHLRILATSREPLGLAGEHVHVLSPLDVPPSDATALQKQRSAAVVLFAARAAAAAPDFVLTDDNVDVVADICRRLDGLPLGLELATARLRTMGLGTLSVRLNQRTEMSGQTQRGADGRHRTLHRLVEWSYDLLSEPERCVFEQLSVFAGGFDLTAAEAVCSVDDVDISIMGHVSSLVDKSMVVLVDPSRPRYRVLEPLREFGRDRLGDRDDVTSTEARHLDWFVGYARIGAERLDSADETQWSDDLHLEFDNFRAAHLTAIRHRDPARAVALVAALAEFAIRRVQYEITVWAEASMQMEGADSEPELAMVMGVAAYGRFVKGEMESAVDLARRAVEVERKADQPGFGMTERVLGNALFYLERTDEALEWMRRMLTAARRSGNAGRIAHALYMGSVAAISTGDPIRGALLAGEAWEAAGRAGSPTALAQANYARGLALESVDPDEALEHLVRSSELAAEAGNRWVEAFALTEVHWLRARRDDPLQALRGCADVVDLWYRGGDWANQWLSLRRVLAIMLRLDAFVPAAVLHGALSAVGASHAMPFEPTDAKSLAHDVDHLRSKLDPAAFADAVRRGASMTGHETVKFVKDEIALLTQSAVG